jgi:hypothetical protein
MKEENSSLTADTRVLGQPVYRSAQLKPHPFFITKVWSPKRWSNKKRDVALAAQNDIRRSLFHNEAGSLQFIILKRI